jgi:prevent-host-death family protein
VHGTPPGELCQRVAAFEAATDGTLCGRSKRPRRDFPNVMELLRALARACGSSSVRPPSAVGSPGVGGARRPPAAHVDGNRGAGYPDYMPDQIDPGVSGAWQIQEAKARFSELLRASVEDGPQTVTRRGVPLAVLVSVEQWNALRRVGAPTLKDLLLAPHARTAQLVPPRRHLRQRPAVRLR